MNGYLNWLIQHPDLDKFVLLVLSVPALVVGFTYIVRKYGWRAFF